MLVPGLTDWFDSSIPPDGAADPARRELEQVGAILGRCGVEADVRGYLNPEALRSELRMTPRDVLYLCVDVPPLPAPAGSGIRAPGAVAAAPSGTPAGGGPRRARRAAQTDRAAPDRPRRSGRGPRDAGMALDPARGVRADAVRRHRCPRRAGAHRGRGVARLPGGVRRQARRWRAHGPRPRRRTLGDRRLGSPTGYRSWISGLRSARLSYVPHFTRGTQGGGGMADAAPKDRARPLYTRVLGPGLQRHRRPLAQRDRARAWAEGFHYPMAFYERGSVPQVAQYVASVYGEDFLYEQYRAAAAEVRRGPVRTARHRDARTRNRPAPHRRRCTHARARSR